MAHLPHYNSVFKRLESEAVTPYLYALITLSAAPLKSIESDFAVDVRSETNIVTSVEVSDGYAHDYFYFKGLVDRTADAGFKMREVSADKGYLGASTCCRHFSEARFLTFHSSLIRSRILVGSYGAKSELWSRRSASITEMWGHSAYCSSKKILFRELLEYARTGEVKNAEDQAKQSDLVKLHRAIRTLPVIRS